MRLSNEQVTWRHYRMLRKKQRELAEEGRPSHYVHGTSVQPAELRESNGTRHRIIVTRLNGECSLTIATTDDGPRWGSFARRTALGGWIGDNGL